MKLSARISLACSMILMLAVGGVIFLQYPPEQSSFYPRCQLYQLTGFFCPGCGSTRCLHALVQGRFVEAAHKNIIAFVLLPMAGGYALFWGWGWLTGRSVRWHFKITPGFGICLVVILIAFGVLRNLPWYPFTLLAPH